MTRSLRTLMILAATVGALVVGAEALGQTTGGAPNEGGSEIGNWGSIPFVAQEALILRAEDRAAIRRLEDKHTKELREFEDRFETEIRALRQRHADEREALRRTFRR